MKSPKTVTLIDLEGKPIPLRENVPLHYFNGEYAHIVDLERPHSLSDYRIYIGSSIHVGICTTDYDSLLPLILFLNDQLTFIRNGMWETLAIYQATIGQYWEVPWYPYEEVKDVIFAISSCEHLTHQPPLDHFIKDYRDVFSKLTPYKGESTDDN